MHPLLNPAKTLEENFLSAVGIEPSAKPPSLPLANIKPQTNEEISRMASELESIEKCRQDVTKRVAVAVAGDINEARVITDELIDKSRTAFDALAALAEESEHPRAYEVFGAFAKILGDLAEQKMKIAERSMKLAKQMADSERAASKDKSEAEARGEGGKIIMTTAQVQKLIADAQAQSGK